MRASRGSHGMSVLEMLIAASLVLMLLALLGQVLVPSLSILGKSSLRNGLQQEGRQALERLERDLRRSTGFGVTLGTAALAIHRMKDGTFTGAQQWEDELAVYAWQKPVLVRRTVPRPEGRCTLAQLAGFASTPTGTEAWLARNATGFSVTKDELGACTLTLQLTEQDETFNFRRVLFLRNH